MGKTTELKITWWNIGGYRSARKALKKWMGKNRPDILILVETTKMDKMRTEIEGYELVFFRKAEKGEGRPEQGIMVYRRKESLFTTTVVQAREQFILMKVNRLEGSNQVRFVGGGKTSGWGGETPLRQTYQKKSIKRG